MNIGSDLLDIKTYLMKNQIKVKELINEFQHNASKANAITAQLKI